MPKAAIRHSLLVLVFSVAVLLGCGAGTSPQDGAVVSSTDGAAQSTTASTNQSVEDAWTEDYATLLETTLTALDRDVSRERYNEYELAAEDLIRECMVQAGFEYHPIVTPGTVTFSESDRVDSREERSIDGWGTSSSWLLPFEAEVIDNSRNAEYTNALTEAEFDAYLDTFFDCDSKALDELASTVPGRPLDEEAASFVEEVGARVNADERYVELLDGWRRCMADLGFDKASYPDHVHALYNETTNFVRILEEVQPISNEKGADFRPSEHLSSELQRAIEESIALEIEVAVADWDCQGGGGNILARAHRKLTDEYIPIVYESGF